jgi:hypothetical protein
MKAKRIITMSILSVAIIGVLTFAIFKQIEPVRAQDQIPPPVPERVSFGMVGITAGQTVRISVANTIMPNDVGLPPGPVRVVMSFRGMSGQLIRNRGGEVIRRIVELDRGDAAFLDLDYDALPPGPVRVQVRPVVVRQPPPTQDSIGIPYDSAVPIVEVINNANGRTQFAVSANPGVIRGFNPQPDPPSPSE